MDTQMYDKHGPYAFQTHFLTHRGQTPCISSSLDNHAYVQKATSSKHHFLHYLLLLPSFFIFSGSILNSNGKVT